MPIYGYRCGTCGHEVEVLQKLSDAPLKTCPNCGGELRKKLYPAGVIFKGSGFYSTDYKSSGGASESGSANGSGSSGEKAPAEKSGDGGGSSDKPASESKAESKAPKSDSTD